MYTRARFVLTMQGVEKIERDNEPNQNPFLQAMKRTPFERTKAFPSRYGGVGHRRVGRPTECSRAS